MSCPGVQRGLGVLDDRHPAVCLDRAQAPRTVVERAGEDHAEDSPVARMGHAAEERVDRGPVTVLAWAPLYAQAPVVDFE